MSDLEETPPADYDDGDVEELENDRELDIPDQDDAEPDLDYEFPPEDEPEVR